jgi:hypothetical protein
VNTTTQEKWECGTVKSRNNAFDWRRQPVNREWHITSIKTAAGARGAQVVAPKQFHVFQKAVK